MIGDVTRPARSETVDGVLRRTARRCPDRTALVFAGRAYTYRELDDTVSRAAGWLRSLGLQPGDRVAAYGTNSDAYLVGYLAAVKGLSTYRSVARSDRRACVV